MLARGRLLLLDLFGWGLRVIEWGVVISGYGLRVQVGVLGFCWTFFVPSGKSSAGFTLCLGFGVWGRNCRFGFRV